MSKKPQPATTAKTPVAGSAKGGVSPIIPARGVALQTPTAGHVSPETEGTFAVGTAATASQQLDTVIAPPLSDTVARLRARDLVEIPANPKLEAARHDLDVAVEAKALSNWEIAMVESMIDLRDLQDVIDAMSAKQEAIRENIKLALVRAEDKTFKFNLGAATLAKGAETVSIIDAKKIPYEYMTTVPDKAKISRALKVPIDVAGVTLTTGKPSLRVTWEE